MADPTSTLETSADGQEPGDHVPYVPSKVTIQEFTWPALLVGVILGIIFGASSLYLLLRVGMTVSASVPIAVLSITLFRAFSRMFGVRQATILENNIVQTAGSAGESIAFGVGVTMPALLLIGFEMSWVRVMTVSVLGGLLGVLMMIPLRRAFIVKQHGQLKYPEGTACAEVLVAGERGGASARMVFLGFGIAFVYKLLSMAGKLWATEPEQNLYVAGAGGTKVGLKGAAISGDLSPEMLGVGYLIGPRIACMIMAGAVLSFWVIGPLIAMFGEGLTHPVPPALSSVDSQGVDKGLIGNMGPGEIYKFYLRYIGAGAVAAGGIISMCRALPLIFGSIIAGVRDLRTSVGGSATSRTDRDLPISVVIVGSLALVIVLAAVPQLGLGLTLEGILGAIMILLFGFLFVTVSSRLTGEVGSSSNPISGMTIATLLLTCLVFVIVGRRDLGAELAALSVAAVVCIASSNGGTTSQIFKTGFLVGATPKYQQYAILLGALTSAVVIGGTMMVLNKGGTHYTKKGFPQDVQVKVPADASEQKAGQPYEGKDEQVYRKLYVRDDVYVGVPAGWYLANSDGRLSYKIDVPIKRDAKTMDAVEVDEAGKPKAEPAPEQFKAPQPQLFALIVEGILGGKLEWGLVITGALIAITMELIGVSALPVAVGMYLGLGIATPIFFGGILRWLADRWRGVSASEAESETSPGVLLSSGYIAGGTLCGLLVLMLGIGLPGLVKGFSIASISNKFGMSIGRYFSEDYMNGDTDAAKLVALGAFALISVILLTIGTRRSPDLETENMNEAGPQ